MEDKSSEEEFQTCDRRQEDLMLTEEDGQHKGKCPGESMKWLNMPRGIKAIGSFFVNIKKRLKHPVSCTRDEPKRLQLSKRWRENLDKFGASDKITRVGTLMYIDESFCILKGSDGPYIFLGLRYDGTEIAVKRMAKTNDNYQELKNEESFLRYLAHFALPFLQYCDAMEDDNFRYLAFKLHEYTLEEYILEGKHFFPIKKLFYQVLLALSVLHQHSPPILHGNLQTKNLLIDINGNIRLANFTKSKFLLTDQTTRPDVGAGWVMKSETLKDENEIQYMLSKEKQEAGKLFSHFFQCMENIHEIHDDMLRKDLIEDMINENPQSRPTVEELLNHPYFWTKQRQIHFLKEVGNKKEVARYQDADPKLIASLEQYAVDGSGFKSWKNNVLPELLQKMGTKKPYAENAFGLLRFIRNVHEHHPEDAAQFHVIEIFPDLFGCTYKFAKEKGWTSMTPLKEMFQREYITASFVMEQPLL